jgi:hypothetical protein
MAAVLGQLSDLCPSSSTFSKGVGGQFVRLKAGALGLARRRGSTVQGHPGRRTILRRYGL